MSINEEIMYITSTTEVLATEEGPSSLAGAHEQHEIN